MYAQDQAGIALSDETIYGPVSEQPPVPSVFDELADIEDEYSDYAAIMKKADPTLDDKEIEEYLRYQMALSKLNYMAGEQNGGVGALRKSLATDETGAFTGGFNRSKDAKGHTVFGTAGGEERLGCRGQGIGKRDAADEGADRGRYGYQLYRHL